MGITQSSLDARPEQLETVGPFALRSTSKNAINILSTITTSLLTNNSIFKLEDLLDPAKGCNQLFIFISSTVEKQFALLKIPDPAFPSKSATLGFIDKEKYGKGETSEIATARQVACAQISLFLVRLVTLMCALTASIKLNDEIASSHVENIDLQSISKNDADFLPAAVPGIFMEDTAKEVFGILSSNGKTTVVKDNDKLVKLIGLDGFIWNLKRGLFYKEEKRTPVFNFNVKYEKVANAQVPPGAYAQPAPGSVSTGADSLTGSSKTNIAQSTMLPGLPPANPAGTRGGTRRRTLAQRRGTRRTRRYVGGAEITLVRINLTEVQVTSLGYNDQIAPKRIAFYLNTKGEYFSERAVETFRRITNAELKPDPISSLATLLDDRFKLILNNRVELVKENADRQLPQVGTTADVIPARKGDKYLSLKGIKKESYDVFKKLKEGLDAKTGASPAGYRAFLLASSYRGGILDTKFCEDSWRGSVFTSSIAFTFLQLLYEDGRSETPVTSEASEDLEKVASAFVGARLATQETVGTSKSFRNILFAPLPGGLDSFCKRPVASRVFNKPEQVAILTTAQKSLRRLFDAHVGAVVKFVERIMTIKRRPTGDYYFRLNEQFVKSPLGALKLLESMIAEARDLLAKHYLEVEVTYNSALLKVGDVR
jgi:hypothetical protein